MARSTEREAEKSDGEVRFSAARPSWSELGLGSRPVIYVRRFLSAWNTEVRTRGTSSSAVPSPRSHATSRRCEPMFVLSICRRSVELAENKGAHRDEHASSLGAQVPALAVRATLPMNGHRFRGSHHGTTHIYHAMYAHGDRLVIEIQSAAGSASMHK